MTFFRPLRQGRVSNLGLTVAAAPVLDERPFVIRPDWSSPFSMTTSYETGISLSTYRSIKQKNSMWSRPLRTLEVAHSSLGHDVDFLRQYLYRTSPRTKVPVAPDEFLSSGMNLSYQSLIASDGVCIQGFGDQNSITGDFGFKRFFPGMRAAFFKQGVNYFFGDDGQKIPSKVVTVLATSRNNVQVDSVPQGLEPGDMCYPVVDCEPLTSATASYQTAYIGGIYLSSREIRGPSTIPPMVTRGGDTPLAATHTTQQGDTYPLLEIDHNWRVDLVEEVVRQGGSNEAGSYLLGTEPRMGWSISTQAIGHAKKWEVLGLFDAMQGRGGVFFAALPHVISSRLKVLGNRNQVQIEPRGNYFEWREIYKAIYLPQTETVHDIVGGPSPSWVLTLDSNIPGTETEFTCVRQASLVEFLTDEVVEEWESLSVGELRFNLAVASDPTPIEIAPL